MDSRLTRILVPDRHFATALDVPGGPPFNAFALAKNGVFEATAAGPGLLTETERVVGSVGAGIKTNGVSQVELKRFVARFKTTLLERMMSVQSKAEMLGDAALTQGNPAGQFLDIDRAIKLKPADIQRVANQYLGADRVVLSYVPA